MTEQQEELLIDSNEYLKSGIHIGTKFKSKYMANFIYKTRPDGLSVLNLKEIDKRLQLAANLLARYEPQDILVVSRRENGWKGLKKLHQLTGIQVITRRYPPGILTNTALETFWEPKIIFVCDPWTDKNALNDAKKIKVPVMSICDTNNYTFNVDKIVPGNNKSAKSLGFIFYLLAKIYVEKRKLKTEIPPVSEWVENWDSLVPPK